MVFCIITTTKPCHDRILHPAPQLARGAAAGGLPNTGPAEQHQSIFLTLGTILQT